jgi:DNA-directed RNA polymerase specialized sigma24 family protein
LDEVSRWHDADVMQGFLRGDAGAREELPRRFHGRLVQLARRIAPDLAERGLEEDVVQRMWELLLQRSRLDYDRRLGGVTTYLGAALRTAAKDVRAENTPPGEPVRGWGKVGPRPPRVRFWLEPEWGGGGSARRPYATWIEVIPDPRDDMKLVRDRLDVMMVLRLARRTAPREVLRALVLVYLLGAQLGEAAKALGMSRSTLRRRIDEWTDEQRWALIA